MLRNSLNAVMLVSALVLLPSAALAQQTSVVPTPPGAYAEQPPPVVVDPVVAPVMAPVVAPVAPAMPPAMAADLIRLWDLRGQGAHTVTPVIFIIAGGVSFIFAALLTVIAGNCIGIGSCSPSNDYTAAGVTWGIGGAVLAGGVTWLTFAIDSNQPRNQEMTEIRGRLQAAGIARPDREARRFYQQRRRAGRAGLGFALQGSF